MNKELAAVIEMHKRYSNITFRKTKNKKDELVIEATQGKSFQGVYFDDKRLSEIVHEVFGAYESDFHATGRPYAPAEHHIVDSTWLKKQLFDKRIKSKIVVRDLALDKSYFSNHLSGRVPISNSYQGMYFYYFKTK